MPFGYGAFSVKSLQPLPTDLNATLLNSPVVLEKIARKSGWLKRQARKIFPIDFIRGILLAVSQCEGSFRLLATSIGLHSDETISKSALWERINPEAVEFYKSVLVGLIASQVGTAGKLIAGLDGICRIVVHDSSLINLHRRLAEHFPSTSNQHGLVNAGLRLQAVFDLIAGEALDLSLTPYRRQDQTASSDILRLVEKGDLILRDLGYLVPKVLEQIVERGAHYISRHLSKQLISHRPEEGGGVIDLLRYLRRHAPAAGDFVDLTVQLGSGQKGVARLETRLVARRLPESVVNSRLRKAHQEEKRLSKRFSASHLALMGWEIYLTSLSGDQASVAKVAALYRLRWRIEIIFKALKSYTPGMKLASHCSNANHVQVLIIAWLCLVVMAARTGSFTLATQANGGGSLAPNCLSLLKVIPKVFRMIAMLLFVACAPGMKVLMDRWFRQIQYHDRYEPRKKRTNMAVAISQALALT